MKCFEPTGRRVVIHHLASLVILVGACAPTAASAANGMELRVDEDTVTYRGIRVTLGTKLDEWKRAFGEPSRYVDRSGGIYVWDDLGLAVSLRLPFGGSDPHVAALRIFFASRDVDFWPRSVYRGAITFIQPGEGARSEPVVASLSASTTASDLAHRQHVSTRFGYPYLSRYTVVRFAANSMGAGPIELCSVQIDPHAVVLPSEASASSSPDDAGAAARRERRER